MSDPPGQEHCSTRVSQVGWFKLEVAEEISGVVERHDHHHHTS